jgi:hypothetical protein
MTQRKIIWPGEKTDSTRKINFPSKEHQSEGMALLHKIGEALGGGGAGIAHGLNDIGANVAQFLFDAYSWATGNPAFQVPRANLKQYAPNTDIGQTSEKVGEFIAPFIGSPALAAESGAGRALFGGKVLPRVALDSLLGAAESENRKSGAAFGALAPAAGKAIKFVKETPMTQRLAAKKLEKARKLAGGENIGIPMSGNFIRDMEYQMLSKHLQPSKLQLGNLMSQASQGSYPAYHDLQSALGDISRELQHPTAENHKGIIGAIASLFSRPKTTASERLTARELDKIREEYIKNAMEHLKKTGKKKIADLETQGRKEYSNYKRFLPYRNTLIGSMLGAVPGAAYIKHIMNHD